MASTSVQASADVIIPGEVLGVAVSEGGSALAIVEPSRVLVAKLPDLALACEIGVDPEAAASEAVFVGPDRLLVVARYSAHSIAYLIDPSGPRKVAELRIESAVHLLASSGRRVLARIAFGTAVLSTLDDQLEIARLPIRSEPACAVGLGDERFLVSITGAFEEWDGANRKPLRRFKLARPQAVRTVGYSAQHLWWIASSDPTRIEVLPVMGRGQASAHVLPEPIAAAVGHVDTEAVLVIGADSRRMYAVEVTGGEPIPISTDAAAHIALAVDRQAVAIVVAKGRVPELVALDAHVRPALVRVPADDEPVDTQPEEAPPVATDSTPPAATDAASSASPASAPQPAAAQTSQPASPATQPSAEQTAQAPAATPSDPTVARRLLEWRDRMRAAARPVWQRSTEPPNPPTWRDELARWGRTIASGLHRDPPPRMAQPVPTLFARLALPEELEPAIAFAYAMHLAGTRGIAPADLAALLGHRWDEALGRGILAASGVLRLRGSRLVLAPAVAAFLDERPPVTGAIVGVPDEALLPDGPKAVLAAGLPLEVVAARCAAVVGAVLVPRPHASLGAIELEARVRGAVPLVERDRYEAERSFGIVLVRVASAAEAAAAELPVVASIADE